MEKKINKKIVQKYDDGVKITQIHLFFRLAILYTAEK